MNKKISLAMTTYNGEKFLREQLESIYSQTRVPDEVIVCDDNSSDGTIQILEEYRQNKGLIYYVNKPALGVNSNFYKAISLCTGDYIALSDQDDIWKCDKIKKVKQIRGFLQSWRNWYTRMIQVHVFARKCGFKSHRLHLF